MPRYIASEDFPIRAQQGDDFTVTFHVPPIFPIITGDIVTFTIYEATSSKTILSKQITSVDTQIIIFTFDDNETDNLFGKFRWVLRINRAGVKTRIGKGIFQFL